MKVSEFLLVQHLGFYVGQNIWLKLGHYLYAAAAAAAATTAAAAASAAALRTEIDITPKDDSY